MGGIAGEKCQHQPRLKDILRVLPAWRVASVANPGMLIFYSVGKRTPVLSSATFDSR